MILIRGKIFLLFTAFIAGFSYLSYPSNKRCLSVFSDQKEISDKVLSSGMSAYRGQEGHIKFTEELTEKNSMAYVYYQVFQSLGGRKMRRLGWRQFYGTVSKYRELQSVMLDADGSLKEGYQGMEMYVRIAENYFSNNMREAYVSVLAVVGKQRMRRLAWRQFYGTVSQFESLKSRENFEDLNSTKISDNKNPLSFITKFFKAFSK